MTETTRPFEAMRRAMVVSQLRTTAVQDVRVLEAMATVPREDFVPEARRDTAYADLSVPLGKGRALNAAMVTALLFDRAAIAQGDRVLVIGAGLGYPLAVARQLAADVTGVEADTEFAGKARIAVPVHVVEGPFEAGSPDDGLFDAIVIDGAVETVPEALIAQLAPGGRLAAGIVENGVTRLAVGRKGGSGFGLSSFADADVAVLPGFARPRDFSFEPSFAS